MSAAPASNDGSWRVGHVGDHAIYYEERAGDAWRRLELECEPTDSGYTIYVGTTAQWEDEPAWVQGRRVEIIRRIKSVLKVPRYEYVGDDILHDDDWATLIEEAGGLSDEECVLDGCKERALKNRMVCVQHIWHDEW
ncbi:MAG TPA: hypothetical protein VIF57_01215 [Polyangia bacterium]|jgi:hypothetical protein